MAGRAWAALAAAVGSALLCVALGGLGAFVAIGAVAMFAYDLAKLPRVG